MVDYTFLFIKFILPEFVSYLGGIGVLCVRNGPTVDISVHQSL